MLSNHSTTANNNRVSTSACRQITGSDTLAWALWCLPCICEELYQAKTKAYAELHSANKRGATVDDCRNFLEVLDDAEGAEKYIKQKHFPDFDGTFIVSALNGDAYLVPAKVDIDEVEWRQVWTRGDKCLHATAD